MAVNGDFEKECERYLLGELSEQEQTQFEELYFEDDALFERFLAVKDDLLDAHARKQLTGEKLKRFESHFLATAPRRLSADRARAFLNGIDAVAPRESKTKSRSSWWEGVSQLLGVPTLALQGALAVVIITAIFGGWLLIRNRSQSSQDQLAGTQPTPTPRAAPSSSPSDPRIADVKPPEVTTPSPAPTNINQRPAPTQVASLTLSPFAPRDGSGTNTLNISPDTRTASLRLLFKGEGYTGYNVALKTVDGRTIAQRSFRRAASSSSGNSLTFNVAASSLTEQDYIVSVTGVTQSRATEALAEYFFRVSRTSSR